jgi:hypothetical protein
MPSLVQQICCTADVPENHTFSTRSEVHHTQSNGQKSNARTIKGIVQNKLAAALQRHCVWAKYCKQFNWVFKMVLKMSKSCLQVPLNIAPTQTLRTFYGHYPAVFAAMASHAQSAACCSECRTAYQQLLPTLPMHPPAAIGHKASTSSRKTCALPHNGNQCQHHMAAMHPMVTLPNHMQHSSSSCITCQFTG